MACGNATDTASEAEALQSASSPGLTGTWVGDCAEKLRSTITISETDGTWEQRSDFFLADDCAESSKTRTDRVYSTFKIADASQWEGSAFASSETIVSDGELFRLNLTVIKIVQTAYVEAGQTACTSLAGSLNTETEVAGEVAQAACDVRNLPTGEILVLIEESGSVLRNISEDGSSTSFQR